MVWVSNALVDQPVTTVCGLLSVSLYEAPRSYTKQQIYKRMLFAWRENRRRRSFLSELISPLSNLNVPVPGLEAARVMEIVEGNMIIDFVILNNLIFLPK